MSIGSIFENNRTQEVRLPAETRFPPNIKKVLVRVQGSTRILEPLGHSWDSFFTSTSPGTTDDFLTERASQTQDNREEF